MVQQLPIGGDAVERLQKAKADLKFADPVRITDAVVYGDDGRSRALQALPRVLSSEVLLDLALLLA